MNKKTKRIATIMLTLVIFCVGAYALGWMNGEAFDPSRTYEAPAQVMRLTAQPTGSRSLIGLAKAGVSVARATRLVSS